MFSETAALAVTDGWREMMFVTPVLRRTFSVRMAIAARQIHASFHKSCESPT
jgi:hypothetical protein